MSAKLKTHRNLLLLREREPRWSKRPDLKGRKLYFLPLIKFKKLSYRCPRRSYDLSIFSSATTLSYLKRRPRSNAVLAIGASTASAIQRVKGERHFVLNNGNSTKMLAWIKRKYSKPVSIFFARSQIGDSTLIQALRGMGHSVFVCHPYATKIIRRPKALSAVIKSKSIGEIFFTSPSSVTAFFRSSTRRSRASWGLRYSCIGPTTAKRLRDFDKRS